MGRFAYSADLLERFPATRGAAIHATGLVNGPATPDLFAAYRGWQDRVRVDIGDTPLSDLAEVKAWRRTFAEFGVKPTQYRSAVEALLRRLTKQGDIPSINALVDMANMISIRHRLPVAVFDQRSVTGATTVRFADGEERFTDLGSGETSPPEAGEVIFVDEAGLVSARRWCWRQSAQSAATPATTEAVITIEGQHETATADVESALDDLLGLLSTHQPDADIAYGALGEDSASFDFD